VKFDAQLLACVFKVFWLVLVLWGYWNISFNVTVGFLILEVPEVTN